MSELPKKVLLMFAQRSVAEGWAHPKELVKLINDAAPGKLEASAALFQDMLFYMDEQKAEIVDLANNRPLTDYDLVYFRYWGDIRGQGIALAMARFCTMHDIPFIDSEVFRTGSGNKITQYMNLHAAQVPFPKTLIAPSSHLLQWYQKYGFDFPLVMKDVGGTRGQHNFLVHDEAEMRRVLAENEGITFVVQTCIPNTGDYRVVVMGDEVRMVIRRTAGEGTHLNNTSQGAVAEVIPIETLPQEVRDLSVHAAKFYGRQIAGVDMVQSTADGRWYCFEVNRAPQIERASFKEEKAKLLAEYLQSVSR